MNRPGKVSKVLARAFWIDRSVGRHALTLAEFPHTNKKARLDSHRNRGLRLSATNFFDVE